MNVNIEVCIKILVQDVSTFHLYNEYSWYNIMMLYEVYINRIAWDKRGRSSGWWGHPFLDSKRDTRTFWQFNRHFKDVTRCHQLLARVGTDIFMSPGAPVSFDPFCWSSMTRAASFSVLFCGCLPPQVAPEPPEPKKVLAEKELHEDRMAVLY